MIKKKIIYIILCIIIFSGTSRLSFAVQDYWTDEDGCISISSNIDTDSFNGYLQFEGKWYYGLCPVQNVDSKTFRIIDFKLDGDKRFAKDKNNVYFDGHIIKDIKPSFVKFESFRLQSTVPPSLPPDDNIEPARCLVYDNDTKYIWSWNGGILVNDIVLNDFIIKGENNDSADDTYYADKKNVYRKIRHDDPGYATYFTLQAEKDTNPAHFYFGYDITPSAVYWYGKKIKEVDSGSFEIYDWSKWDQEPFAHDKNNVYSEGKIVYGADVQSFVDKELYDSKGEIVDHVVMDNQKVFYRDEYRTVYQLKKEYPAESSKIDQSISSAIKTYETKYPNYTPQPAVPALGSPEEAELKKFQEEITKAQQEEAEANRQDMMKKGIWAIGILAAGGIGYGVMRKRRKGKK